MTVVVGAVDLVERRNSNSPLHPARQIELATLIESMPEAVFVLERQGKVVEANRAAETLIGVPRQTLIKLSPHQLSSYMQPSHAPDPKKSDSTLVRALRGEFVQQERHRISTPGATAEALVSANPIRERGGQIVGAMVVVRDITELAELQQHCAEIERQGAIGTMAASLTHDFNNVLDTISKAATVLEIVPGESETDRKIVLRMIRNAVTRGAEIVSNVRQYLTGSPVSRDAVDLKTLLEEAIELTRPMWSGASISLIRQLSPVPLVEGNVAELRRVFTNLIINAIESMPSGGTLTVGCEYKDARVAGYVADTGKGIPRENFGQIFAPYYTTKQKGTGLGLSSALRAVRAQRGNITFTSEVGAGSRFVVELPAQEKSRHS